MQNKVVQVCIACPYKAMSEFNDSRLQLKYEYKTQCNIVNSGRIDYFLF